MFITDESCNRNRSVDTPDSGEQTMYQQILDVSKVNQVTFKVKACNDAHVALSTTTTTDSQTYEIVLGGWNNTKSVVRFVLLFEFALSSSDPKHESMNLSSDQ